MARSDLYRPKVLPEFGAVYPCGHLTRLEVNREDDHTEVKWDFPKSKRSPLVLWSVEKNAIVIPLFNPRIVKKGRGTPQGFEPVAKAYADWQWAEQKNWSWIDWGDLPEMEVVGSMIAIEYWSNKHRLGWTPHIHRPAGTADIVSANAGIKKKWIFIKGPRMRATPLGIAY